jgi:hypothetical protein
VKKSRRPKKRTPIKRQCEQRFLGVILLRKDEKKARKNANVKDGNTRLLTLTGGCAFGNGGAGLAHVLRRS